MNNIPEQVDPPWLESFLRVQKQTDAATRALEKIGTLNPIFELPRSVNLSSLESTLNMSELRVNSATASIQKLIQSGRFTHLKMQESQEFKSLKNLANLSSLSSMVLRQLEEGSKLGRLGLSRQLSSTVLERSEAFKGISRLCNLESIRALYDLKNSPFHEDTSLIVESDVELSDSLNQSLEDLDAELSKEISSVTDFNDLPDKTKRVLTYIYHYYLLPILIYIVINAYEAQKESALITTSSEAKVFSKAPNTNFDREVLKGFRVVTADSVNFRVAAGMKSEIITVLPIGTLVEVLDKSQRSWLFVEVEIEGRLEQGWVSRRYTTHFK